MAYEYNPTYFNGRQLISRKGIQGVAFRTFVLRDGMVLGLFQGKRGDNPLVDFIVKFLEPGRQKETRTPSHLHWVVDLLLKAETHRNSVASVVEYYRRFWDEAAAFRNVDERDAYTPLTPGKIRQAFGELDHHGTYSLEYLSYLLELFAICEKATPRPNKMYPALLDTLLQYFLGERDFYQVLNAAAPPRR